MQTSASHPLDLLDREQQGRDEPIELTAARVEYWASMSEEKMRAIVDDWKSRMACNQRKERRAAG